MKNKLTSIRVNLLMLLIKIEKLECSEEINYNLYRKLEEINEKLVDVEALITEMEAIEEI